MLLSFLFLNDKTTSAMEKKYDLRKELKKHFGFDNFKNSQKDIIQDLLDGKNVFVLATIAEILGVEILGRSRYETIEEKSNYRRILKTRISLGRQLLIRSTVSSSFPWTTSNLQLITFPAA